MAGEFRTMRVIPIIFALGVGWLVFGFYTFNKWNKGLGNFKNINYDIKIADKLKVLRRYKGITYIQLTTGEKIAVQPLRNNLYNPSSIYDAIYSGDSIYKDSGSDSVFLKSMNGDVRWYLNQ